MVADSGGSGFGGSLFSGTTATTTTVGTSATVEGVGSTAARRGKEEEDWAKKATESYYLQLTLATRVTWQAFLAEDWAGLIQESTNGNCEVSSDSATVSYRLWVF